MGPVAQVPAICLVRILMNRQWLPGRKHPTEMARIHPVGQRQVPPGNFLGTSTLPDIAMYSMSSHISGWNTACHQT